jgi:Protein of unknown function (DUF2630)
MEASRVDNKVLGHIQDLVEQEHRLMEQGSLAESDQQQLSSIQVQLDQCWDLLRQRRALRETGGDPESAHVRPPNIVEKYVG